MQEILKKLREQKQKLEDQIKSVDAAIAETLAETVIRCGNTNCLTLYKIRELDYIDEQTYEDELGYGGSYRVWHEGQWICPKCNYRNRLYKQPEINNLKHLFKSSTITKKRNYWSS